MDRFTTLLTGIGIGAGVGLLFAPRSGVRTRVLLAKKARRQTEALKDQATELRDRAVSLIERGEREATRQKEGVRRAVETVARAYREALG